MRALKIIVIFILILFAVLSGLYFYIKIKSINIDDKGNLEASIDKQAQKYIANKNANGLVIGVVKDGRVYLQGYRSTGKGSNGLVDGSTIFELASTSKLFTTSTLQILVDNDELILDAELQTILGDKITLPAIAQKTTLRHLATHLSGFPSVPNSFIEKMTDDKNPYKDLITQDIYDYLKTCEGKQKDGTFEYSNFGMGLLGHLLEIRSGIKYEQLVKDKLLGPLGMDQTFVKIDSSNETKIIQGFDENGNPTPIWTDNVLTGAGSFLSNGNDMIKFLKANLKQDASSVSKSLLTTHKQQLKGETGLGWILPSSTDQLLGNKSIVWHSGMSGGYSSFIAIDKTNNYGFFVLTNKAVDVTPFGMKLAKKIRSQSWKH